MKLTENITDYINKSKRIWGVKFVNQKVRTVDFNPTNLQTNTNWFSVIEKKDGQYLVRFCAQDENEKTLHDLNISIVDTIDQIATKFSLGTHVLKGCHVARNQITMAKMYIWEFLLSEIQMERAIISFKDFAY